MLLYAPPMTKSPQVVLCLTLLCILLVPAASAQTHDPHLPPPPLLGEFVQFDDMLLTPEQYAGLTTPGAEVSRRQAQPLGLNVRFANWDWGVIPYELAPNFDDNERRNLTTAMRGWESVAPVLFVPRTTQSGYLAVTKDDVVPGTANTSSPCFASVGQGAFGRMQRANLGSMCARGVSTIYHEFGHALGFHHEHQRADRDNHIIVDFSNIGEPLRIWFTKLTYPLVGPYDLLSIMHYSSVAFALDASRPSMVARDAGLTSQMGRQSAPSPTDHNVLALLYNAQLNESAIRLPTEATRRRFDRNDMLIAMERLHSFYMSRVGLNRPQGLSIDGRPDFLGIAQWIFDIYLPARSAGFSQFGAFDIVVASITRTDEWRQKNPGRAPLTPAGFRPTVSFSRDEFLEVLNRLDRFYSAPEGLQRPNGLSISGGPDFLGIATWIFDIYLAERLNGISPNGAWTITENAIRATNEWRSKH